MPKRKHSDKNSESYLLKKIRKLEKRLKRNKRSNRLVSDSSGSHSPIPTPPAPSSPQDVPEEESLGEIEVTALEDLSASANTAPAVPLTGEITQMENEETEKDLDEDMLELLGETPSKEKKYGAKIQKDIALRWEHIATTGLTKENRKELVEKYFTPENCKKIDPPLLNREIKAAISEAVIKKDKSIETKQRQLSATITCLGQALTKALNSDNKDHDMIKLIMEAGRLVCDSQHTESMLRRSFICSGLKKDFKEHLYETEIDKYLFGEKLPDTLKSAKAVQKSSSEIKLNQPSTSKGVTRKNPLNWKGTLSGNRQPAVTRRYPQPAVAPPAPVPPRRRPVLPPPPSHLPPPPPPPPRSQLRDRPYSHRR